MIDFTTEKTTHMGTLDSSPGSRRTNLLLLLMCELNLAVVTTLQCSSVDSKSGNPTNRN
jgi:hypothetical protein